METLTDKNRRLIASLYRAATAGDQAHVAALMAPDLILHEPLFLKYGGTYQGAASLQQAMIAISQFVAYDTLTMQYLVADGDKVFAAVQVQEKETGHLLQMAEEFTIQNGKIVEMKVFFFDAGSLLKIQ